MVAHSLSLLEGPSPYEEAQYQRALQKCAKPLLPAASVQICWKNVAGFSKLDALPLDTTTQRLRLG
jgi:hypothetical protein